MNIYIYIYILHIFRCITCFFCKSLHSRNSACSTPKLLISVFMTSSVNLLLDSLKIVIILDLDILYPQEQRNVLKEMVRSE